MELFFPTLSSLTLSCRSEGKLSSLPYLLVIRSKALRTVVLDGVVLSGSGLVLPGSITSLTIKQAEMQTHSLRDSELAPIKEPVCLCQFPSLTSLDISQAFTRTPFAMPSGAFKTNSLLSLSLSSIHAPLMHKLDLPNLRSLNISHCFGNLEGWKSIIKAATASLHSSNNTLQTLGITTTSINLDAQMVDALASRSSVFSHIEELKITVLLDRHISPDRFPSKYPFNTLTETFRSLAFYPIRTAQPLQNLTKMTFHIQRRDMGGEIAQQSKIYAIKRAIRAFISMIRSRVSAPLGAKDRLCIAALAFEGLSFDEHRLSRNSIEVLQKHCTLQISVTENGEE
jgi:hypothetical protein